MSETITLQALDLSGETLTMFLRKSDGSLLNADGDAMTESESTGVFTATLAESRVGLGPLAVRICAGDETADTLLYDGFLVEGSTVIDSTVAAALDSATLAKIDDILTDTGTTLPGLINAIEGGGGSGTGARTVTITVNDGTTVLQNATVRMTEGANTFTALTNVSGVAVFNVDDATYTVAITKSGYSYAGTTLVVNGTETATYSMTVVSITPGTNNNTTGFLVTRTNGVTANGLAVSYQMSETPTGDTGSSYDATVYTARSVADGIAELTLVRGAKYWIWRGDIRRPEETEAVLIPANAGTTYELPSHLG
jgi:hypothetical protein